MAAAKSLHTTNFDPQALNPPSNSTTTAIALAITHDQHDQQPHIL